MRLVKYTHACVRVEHGGAVLVIDPGVWSEPEALHGADAVLVTHAHSDHVDRLRLAGLGAPVYAPAGAGIPGVDVTEVHSGEDVTVAGLPVRAVGGAHATIYGGQPDVPNLGYLVADGLYHPGDALHVPDRPVRTLLVPVHASWLKLAEAIDFVRTVGPQQAHGIHDAQINERGLSSVTAWLAEQAGCQYRHLAPGEAA